MTGDEEIYHEVHGRWSPRVVQGKNGRSVYDDTSATWMLPHEPNILHAWMMTQQGRSQENNKSSLKVNL